MNLTEKVQISRIKIILKYKRLFQIQRDLKGSFKIEDDDSLKISYQNALI